MLKRAIDRMIRSFFGPPLEERSDAELLDLYADYAASNDWWACEVIAKIVRERNEVRWVVLGVPKC